MLMHSREGVNIQWRTFKKYIISLWSTVCPYQTSFWANRKLLHAKVTDSHCKHTHISHCVALTRWNYSLSCPYKDETNTSDIPHVPIGLQAFVWQKNSMTHLLRRVHINCVGSIGWCPCHSTIGQPEAGCERVCWSYSMLNRWILMIPSLFMRGERAKPWWGGRLESFFKCVTTLSQLASTCWAPVSLALFFLPLMYTRIFTNMQTLSFFIMHIRSLHVVHPFIRELKLSIVLDNSDVSFSCSHSVSSYLNLRFSS